MNGGSRISVWVFFVVLAGLASCATEPYYEAAPTSPVNVSPGEDVDINVNAQITFVWRPTENTQFYEFHIYNQTNKDTAQYDHANLREENVCQEGMCRLTLNVNLPTSEGHAWRVRAGNNAGLSEWNRTRFNMIEASPDVNTSAESNAGAETSTSAETSASAETSTSEQASTNVEVATNSEALPSVELITNIEETVEPGARTQASNGAEIETDASAASKSPGELNGPDLLLPVEDAQVATGTVIDFKWRSLPDAISYDFYIYNSSGTNMVESLTEVDAAILCQDENVCVLTRVVSMPVASHSWKVRANFENNQSLFTSSRFTVRH